jgi:hypothetical protein
MHQAHRALLGQGRFSCYRCLIGPLLLLIWAHQPQQVLLQQGGERGFI